MADEDVLQHIKDVELMILKDFAKICDENDIEYYLIYGTQIGAIRHQGFIPWDDDVDVILFRKDYEKFLKVMEENPNEKYTIFDLSSLVFLNESSLVLLITAIFLFV